MFVKNKNIDNGKKFDWGRTSENYAKYRDIYPEEFYEKIIKHGLCVKGQYVLDIGTGTGVLPRNMSQYGAKWTGIDISEEQIKQAELLSENMNVEYYVSSAENTNFPDNTFDVITACQCFWYFKHEQTAPVFFNMLKPNGHLLILCMSWLPFEDKIAGASENLILKYNPQWTGAGETIHSIEIPDCYNKYFELVYHDEYSLKVHFTRESWNGRLKACRGIGASLTDDEIHSWENEHLKLLSEIAPKEFDILHYVAVAELKVKK